MSSACDHPLIHLLTQKQSRLKINPTAHNLVREIADFASLHNTVLRTEGRLDFELLNDAFNHIAGHLVTTTLARETWLFAMTCENREFLRSKCVRCFLIRPAGLEISANWHWCRKSVLCKRPWPGIASSHCIRRPN